MNSSAWDKFRKQQSTEREQLRRLLTSLEPLLTKCRTTAPNLIELAALAALLHSFYTGVENIFKRAAIEIDGYSISGEFWHRDLLRQMTQPTAHRSGLLSEELHQTFLEYLRFRHVFRTAYSFDLDWQKMSHLVLGMEETLRRLEGAPDTFIASAK